MNENQDKSQLWERDGVPPDTGAEDNLVENVVTRTSQRLLIKDALFLILSGFSSIFMGLLKPKPEHPTKPER